jgi:hypothetical protein
MISVRYFCDGADGGCRIIFFFQYLTRRCGRIRTHCGLTVIFNDARTVACQSVTSGSYVSMATNFASAICFE